MSDDRPWIVLFRKAGRRTVYRFASKGAATTKARELQREGHGPIMVFHATRGH